MATIDEVSQPDLWHEIQADFRNETGDVSEMGESGESEESEQNDLNDTESEK